MALLIGNGKAQENADQINEIIKQLRSSDPGTRAHAASDLGQIGPAAKDAVPALIATLKDQDELVRAHAASALGHIGPAAKDAVLALIAALKDQEKEVRAHAAGALGGIGPAAKDIVPALIAALKDHDELVRAYAAGALGLIGPEAKDAVSVLITAIKDQNRYVSRSAASALGQIGPAGVPALIIALKDQEKEVRISAVLALGEIGPEAKDVVPDLIIALKDQEKEVRNAAASTLGKIAAALFDNRSIGSLDQLKAAYVVLNAHPDSLVKEEAAQVKRTIDYFESLWWVGARERTVKIISAYLAVSIAVAAYLLLQLTWLLLLWLRPLSLLKVIASLSRTGEKYKLPKLDIPVPLKTALVFPLFHYRPRLLDAWVQHYRATAKDNFAKNKTVAQRNVYVPMPALIDGQMRENLSAATFQGIFDKKKVTVLIAGEGGAGKTSLACQMAIWAMADGPQQWLCKSHRMLPVLIEANLSPAPDKKDALVEAVRGGLRELIGEPEPIFEELLLQLLRKRRVLVIVDSLSELDETTRKSVRPAQAEFPIAALLITSRIDEYLEGAPKTLLRPLRLKSNRLSEFMDGYLKQLGKRDLFDDEEYFDACRRLSLLVGDRDITVLIAKMYAEQMVAAKEEEADAQTTARKLPRNLPDLMLGYVKRLNDQVQADRQDIQKIVGVAKVVAWECLKQTCRPTAAKRADVLKVCSGEANAEVLLEYLERRLQLIQTAGPIADLIRFSLDPLAEYLAALYLVERCGKNEELWGEFFDRVKGQPDAPEAIKGFLLAVRDCCIENGSDLGVPSKVKDEVAKMAGLDPEAISTAQLKQRVNLWVNNLKLPDAEDRKAAIEMLWRIGPAAKKVVPALITALKDKNADVRGSAAEALWQIGPAAKDAIPALIASLTDQNENPRFSVVKALGGIGPAAAPALIIALTDQNADVRSSAAVALGFIRPKAKEAVPALIAALQDQDAKVRVSAADALMMIRPAAKDAVPALIIALEDQDEDVRVSAAAALGNIGPAAKDGVPALITALEDQNANVRYFAAIALRKIGPAAKVAIPALTAALNDRENDVRSSAANALEKITAGSTDKEVEALA